jgi:hypothetical protein
MNDRATARMNAVHIGVMANPIHAVWDARVREGQSFGRVC